MACKEGQFVDVELFSINLNAQYVNGMTHSEFANRWQCSIISFWIDIQSKQREKGSFLTLAMEVVDPFKEGFMHLKVLKCAKSVVKIVNNSC